MTRCHSREGFVHELSEMLAQAGEIAFGLLEQLAHFDQFHSQVVLFAEHRQQRLEFHEFVVGGAATYVGRIIVKEMQHNMFLVRAGRQFGSRLID